MTTSAKPTVVCITGPTATGKTSAAVAISRSLCGEVLSMDSMQIYKGLDIGTAKVIAEEMQGIPHHLLSYVEPASSYTVAEYQRDARAVMRDILNRQKLPVFAGGTGLYLQAVSRPLMFTKAGESSEVRQELEAIAEEPDGREVLYKRLLAVDPERAQDIHINNTRRVIRALEVYLTTGIPMSKQASEWEADTGEDWVIFALNWPRDILYSRINRRVDLMIDTGLVAEVEQILSTGIAPSAQAMQAIGYKEIVTMLQRKCTLTEAIEAVKANTRHYAKRQITWLKRDPRVQWVDLSQYDNMKSMHDDLIGRIMQHIGGRHDGN